MQTRRWTSRRRSRSYAPLCLLALVFKHPRGACGNTQTKLVGFGPSPSGSRSELLCLWVLCLLPGLFPGVAFRSWVASLTCFLGFSVLVPRCLSQAFQVFANFVVAHLRWPNCVAPVSSPNPPVPGGACEARAWGLGVPSLPPVPSLGLGSRLSCLAPPQALFLRNCPH